MQEIGVMAMPSDFAYRDVYAKGKPRHDKYDWFSILHPNMDRGKRAKIFAPFDALKGFSELIGSKQNVYCFKKQLNEDEQNELNRRLTVLKNLTYNSRMARQNRVLITATYYAPCTDTNCKKWLLMKSATVRANTLEGYQQAMQRHILNHIGDRFIDEITADDLKLLMVPVAQKSKSVYGTVNMLLKCVFYSALASGVIKENPAADINPRGGKKARSETHCRISRFRLCLRRLRACRLIPLL